MQNGRVRVRAEILSCHLVLFALGAPSLEENVDGSHLFASAPFYLIRQSNAEFTEMISIKKFEIISVNVQFNFFVY